MCKDKRTRCANCTCSTKKKHDEVNKPTVKEYVRNVLSSKEWVNKYADTISVDISHKTTVNTSTGYYDLCIKIPCGDDAVITVNTKLYDRSAICLIPKSQSDGMFDTCINVYNKEFGFDTTDKMPVSDIQKLDTILYNIVYQVVQGVIVSLDRLYTENLKKDIQDIKLVPMIALNTTIHKHGHRDVLILCKFSSSDISQDTSYIDTIKTLINEVFSKDQISNYTVHTDVDIVVHDGNIEREIGTKIFYTNDEYILVKTKLEDTYKLNISIHSPRFDSNRMLEIGLDESYHLNNLLYSIMVRIVMHGLHTFNYITITKDLINNATASVRTHDIKRAVFSIENTDIYICIHRTVVYTPSGICNMLNYPNSNNVLHSISDGARFMLRQVDNSYTISLLPENDTDDIIDESKESNRYDITHTFHSHMLGLMTQLNSTDNAFCRPIPDDINTEDVAKYTKKIHDIDHDLIEDDSYVNVVAYALLYDCVIYREAWSSDKFIRSKRVNDNISIAKESNGRFELTNEDNLATDWIIIFD